MKTTKIQKLFIGIFLAALAIALNFLLNTCEPEIRLTDPVKTPIALSFIKAKAPFDQKVNNVRVSIHDPQGQIVNSRGITFSAITLDYGVMTIAFKQDAVLTEESPYRFTVHAEADGFIENVQTIVLTKETPQFIPIYLAEIDDPPPSMAANQISNLGINGGILTNGLSLSAAFSEGPKAEFSIPAGTQLFCEGRPIENFEGESSLSLAFGTSQDITSNLVFPNGYAVIDALDSLGNPIASIDEPFFFSSYGWATIELKLGDLRVDSFSNPVKVRMPVNPLETDDPIVIQRLLEPAAPQAQVVPLWSLDNTTGQWKEESAVQFINDGNGLEAEFEINHLSTWNLDLKGPSACTASDLVISYTNTGCPRVLYSRLIYEDPNTSNLTFVPNRPTGAGLTSSYFLTYVTGTHNVTIANYPNSPQLQFSIYAAEVADATATALQSTSVVNGCQNSPISLQGNIPAGGGSCDIINLNFSFTTINGGTETAQACNNAIWFRVIPSAGYNISDDANLDEWSFAGIMDGSGNLPTALFDYNENNQRIRLLVWWHDGVADQSIRFTLPPQALNFTNTCGALAATPTQVGAVTANGVTNTPTISLSRHCFRQSGASNRSCPANVNAGDYTCEVQANSASERGLDIIIDNLPNTFSFPICN